MSADHEQVGGTHYMSKYAPWDFTVDMFDGCFFRGNANKYLTRWRRKDGIKDLRKAKHYLEKFLELLDQGRVPFPVVKSYEARMHLVLYYANINDVGLAESNILAMMAAGDFEGAVHEVAVLIAQEEA